MRALAAWVALSCVSPGVLNACSTYQDDLMSAQQAFEQSKHERALALLRMLDQDTWRLSVVDRARYAYLRGMTDYRVGYRADARHWLALALVLDQTTPGSLPPDWERRMGESLNELNEEVYAAGIGSLSKSPAPGSQGSEDRGVDAAR